jgi:hypothetical protein
MTAVGRGALCGFLLIAAFGCGAEQASGPRSSGTTDSSTDDESEGAADEDVLVPQQGEAIGPASAPPFSCSDPGVALCFSFDGTSSDQSPAALAPSETANLAFVAGRRGQAIAFGPDSALRFAPHPAFDLPSGAASIEAWIQRSSSSTDAVVFDDDARFSLTIDAGGHVWCKSSKGEVRASTVLPVGQWVHVACVVDAGTMRAYAAGIVDGIGIGGIDPSPMSAAAIGGNAPSGEPFVGIIDSLRVFRVARTPEEIASAAGR